ncbi:hypothetical protein DL768_010537 [Monosporascus sp. mg162]|nr:hypothetical protein DL768_010537 [Monosporascus sp. mg162]
MPYIIEPFIFLLAYNIVVCTECRFGCVGGEVEAYLNTAEYVRRSAPERRGIGDRVRRVPGGRRPAAAAAAAAAAAVAAAGSENRPWRTSVERGRRPGGGEGEGEGEGDGDGEGDGEGDGDGDRTGAANTGGGGGGGADNGWRLMLSTYGDRLAAEEEKRRRTADGPGGVDAESTWVKEMGWAKHFAGADLVELYKAGAGPISSAVRKKLRDAAAKEE